MRSWIPRTRRHAGLAVAFGLVGTLGAPSAAAAPDKWTYFDSSYYMRMQAAAVQPAIDIPQPLVPGLGFSSVMLEKDVGEPRGFCQTRGIGAHYTDLAEQVVLNQNPGSLSNAGVFNPTEAGDTEPDRFKLETLNSRKPQVRNLVDGTVVYDIPSDGTGVRWQAVCDDEAGGRGTGNLVDAGGIQAVGSATTGRLDKSSGAYTGTSRAFVAGLETAGGTLDFVSSVMQVKQLPGKEAKITYRIGTSGGTLAAGVDVPASRPDRPVQRDRPVELGRARRTRPVRADAARAGRHRARQQRASRRQRAVPGPHGGSCRPPRVPRPQHAPAPGEHRLRRDQRRVAARLSSDSRGT